MLGFVICRIREHTSVNLYLVSYSHLFCTLSPRGHRPGYRQAGQRKALPLGWGVYNACRNGKIPRFPKPSQIFCSCFSNF